MTIHLSETIEQLRSLAATGLSASQCASHFPGMTRNAAIGLGGRNGIKFLGTGHGRKCKRKPRSPRISKMLSLYEEPVTIEPLREGNLTIYDLQADSCRWIDGDVFNPNHRYCGQKQLIGYPWCPNHCNICYSPSEHRYYAPRPR